MQDNYIKRCRFDRWICIWTAGNRPIAAVLCSARLARGSG